MFDLVSILDGLREPVRKKKKKEEDKSLFSEEDFQKIGVNRAEVILLFYPLLHWDLLVGLFHYRLYEVTLNHFLQLLVKNKRKGKRTIGTR